MKTAGDFVISFSVYVMLCHDRQLVQKKLWASSGSSGLHSNAVLIVNAIMVVVIVIIVGDFIFLLIATRRESLP